MILVFFLAILFYYIWFFDRMLEIYFINWIDIPYPIAKPIIFEL